MLIVLVFCWENLARTYFVQGDNGINRYLKIQPVGTNESIEIQAQKLLWLKGKLSVPKVIDKGVLGNYEYLITLEMIGSPASDKNFHHNIDEVIELSAKGLRTIHEVPIENCPFDNRLNNLIEIIRYNKTQGLINTSKLNWKFGEDNLDILLNEIEAYTSVIKEDLVFTHGDYSMPNVIISDRVFVALSTLEIAE